MSFELKLTNNLSNENRITTKFSTEHHSLRQSGSVQINILLIYPSRAYITVVRNRDYH